MDKRKQKTIERVQANEQIWKNDRDNIIQTLMEIQLQEEAIKYQEEHIRELKVSFSQK